MDRDGVAVSNISFWRRGRREEEHLPPDVPEVGRVGVHAEHLLREREQHLGGRGTGFVISSSGGIIIIRRAPRSEEATALL